MKRIGLTILFLCLIAALLAVHPPSLVSQAAPNPPPAAGEINPALEAAVRDKFTSRQKSIDALQAFEFTIDNIIPSQDGRWALLWLAPLDPQTEEVIATEPMLAVARQTDIQTGDWEIILPSDVEWSQALEQLPAYLLPEQLQKSIDPSPSDLQGEVQGAPFRGYRLPWASGNQKRLSGSIGHFLIYNSCSEQACRYAYDFADGTMFPLLAAKGGTVYTYYDGCANYDYTCTNYLVLKDESTTPTTYQIYYHLANGSIPSSLKKIGEPVVQGQYIGNVDDTGYSSGHHLHFHVSTSIWTYTTYYGQRVPWGYSVDIRFDDVAINDGTPRTCYEAANWPAYGTQCNPEDKFTSGNVGANPPSGSLSLPAAGTEVTGPGLTVAGTASDDLGVTKVQVIARGRDRIWRDVGSPVTSVPFSTSVDLCSASVPDGPVDIALRVWDVEGNVAPGSPGLRTVVKNYACAPPPPACTPTADKIVLYSEPNYQGACREYAKDSSGGEITVSDLASDLNVGADNAASIRVGSNVRALLFSDTGYGGRHETLEVSDPNLADNRIGADTLSSLIVQPRAMDVGEPSWVTFPPADNNINPDPGDVVFSGSESLSAVLYAKGATSFNFQLAKMEGGLPNVVKYVQNLPQPFISLGSLSPGLYRLVGISKNSSGDSNTDFYYFTVNNNSLSATAPQSVPYIDGLDTDTGDWQTTGGWIHSALNDGRTGWRFSGYTDPNKPVNYGSLTSPPVTLPAQGASYLRFSYRAVTESSYSFWDQRRVQISVDGGPFEDIQIVENGGPLNGQQKDPLWDDAQGWWLQSPAIDLSAYAGRTVRVRFYFFTADALNNTGDGWQIDSVSISSEPDDTSCAESARNDSLASATPVSLGQTVSGALLCPRGDVDFYRFNGTAGQKVAFRVEAGAIGSNLDPYLYLLDSSGGLILANDDIDPGVVRDSAFGVVLPHTGTYYLKVKAWDHPQAGGSDQFYTLRLLSDNAPPVASIASPSNPWVSGSIFNVSASALDTGSGVTRVDFYWHNPDWINGSWELIGTDAEGSDGWSMTYDLSAKGNITNSGIYIEARDAADNTRGAMLLGLKVDTEKPVSQMYPLESETRSTAVKLQWSAFDAGSGLDELNLQYRLPGADWQDWLPNPAITPPESWFLGQFGQTYEFRMRARDKANLLEDYPPAAEAFTTVESACSAEPDIYEQNGADNNREGAAPLPLEIYQAHNLCGLADVDWVSFPAQAGVRLMIAGVSYGGGAAVKLEIYNSAGALLESFQAPGLGKNAVLIWTPPDSGTYFLKASPIVEGLAGTDARYAIWIGSPREIYLPVIGR